MKLLSQVYLGIGIAIAVFGSTLVKKNEPEKWNSYSVKDKIEAVVTVIFGWPLWIIK